MGRDKRSLNPAEAHRRSQKRKLAERKRAARKEVLSKIPLSRRDPSKLLTEIEKLREAEAKGHLDGPGRLKRRRLEDQFTALNKARDKAKLPTMALPEFDPEDYLNAKKISNDEDSPLDTKSENTLDIPLPTDEPYETGVPGLPVYKISKLEDEEYASTIDIRPIEEECSPIISAGPSVSKKAHLEAQIDQFLNEIDGL